MISSRYRFLFIHVPKTGGNAIQSLLLPLSDDRMVLRESQDGSERFNLRGPITPHKHATLQEYYDAADFRPNGLQLISVIRPPFARLVSLYFSPHRWIGKQPIWDIGLFRAMLRRTPSTAAYLTAAGCLHRPDFLLHFDRLVADFKVMAERLGLPPMPPLPHRNRGAAPYLQTQVLADESLRAEVEKQFECDMELLAVPSSR